MPPVFDLDAYLERIGYRGERVPDLASLRALVTAHLAAIPFENIDPMAGFPVTSDLSAVENKIVKGQRGGFCFEVNGLLLAALRALGFSVTPFCGRVRWGRTDDQPHPPRNHMTLLVDLGAEGRWLADVGFGGDLMDEPLRFETSAAQETTMGRFKLEERDGLFWVYVQRGEVWRALYVFDLVPALAADFEIGSWFASTHPAAIMRNRLVVERVREGRRYRLIDRLFTVEGPYGEVLSSQVLTSGSELYAVLSEAFDIVPPYDPEHVFGRIAPPAALS